MKILKEIIDKLEATKIITDNGCWKTTIISHKSQGYLVIQHKFIKTGIHRVSAAYFLGLDLSDSSLYACHKDECSDKECWNPDHLYVGTAYENNMDSIRKGRKVFGDVAKYNHPNSKVTHCPKNHPYDEKNTRLGKKGERLCIECQKERNRAQRLKYKLAPKIAR